MTHDPEELKIRHRSHHWVGKARQMGERRLSSWLEACPGLCRRTPPHSVWECSRRDRHNSLKG